MYVNFSVPVYGVTVRYNFLHFFPPRLTNPSLISSRRTHATSLTKLYNFGSSFVSLELSPSECNCCMKESVKRCCVLNCSIDAVVVVFGRLVVCMYGLLTGVAETNVFVALIEGTYEFSELDAAPEYELESGTLKLNGVKPILEDVPKKGFGKGYPET